MAAERAPEDGAAGRTAQPPPDAPPGARLGPYRLLGEDGLFAAPGLRRWHGRAHHQGRLVTVVTLASAGPGDAANSVPRQTLRHEAEATRRVAAATGWVPPVVDEDLDADVPWLACHPALALPLAEVATGAHPFSARAVRLLGAALADALAPLHGAGLAFGALSARTVGLAADGPRLTGLGGATPYQNTADDVRDLAALLVTLGLGAPAPGGAPSGGADGLAALLARCQAPEPAARPGLAELRAALLDAEAARAGRATGPAGATGAAGATDVAGITGITGVEPAHGGPEAPEHALPGALPPEVLARLVHHAEETLGQEPPADEAPPQQPPADGTYPTFPTYHLAPPAPRPPEPAPDAPRAPVPVPGDGPPAQEPAAAPPPPAATGATGATTPAAPGRRSLLAATAAGAVGLLVGSAGVAGWVAGRGDGVSALADPNPVDASGAPGGAPGRDDPPEGAPPAPLWRYDGPDLYPAHHPLLHDGAVVLVGATATGVDARTGQELWSRRDLGLKPLLDQPTAPVALPDGLVAAYTRQESLVAFEAATGAQRWSEERYDPHAPDHYGHQAERISGIPDHPALLLVTTDGGADDAHPVGVAVYDTERREELWHLPLAAAPEHTARQPVGDQLLVLDVSDEEPRLRAYRLRDGVERWDRTLDAAAGFTGYLGMHLTLHHVLTAHDGVLRATDMATGQEAWSRALRSPGARLSHLTGAAVPWDGAERELLFLADDDRRVFAVDATTGVELWRAAPPPWDVLPDDPDELPEDTVHTLAVTASGRTLLAGMGVGVAAYDVRRGRLLWRFQYLSHGGSQRWWIADAARDAERAADHAEDGAGAGAVVASDGSTVFALPAR